MSLIERLTKERMGFLKDNELPEVVKENRFQMVLVRTGLGRFLCPAQDAGHYIKIIEKSDYIRDVSIYTGAV